MREKHRKILEEFGASLISEERRVDGKGSKAYIVEKDGVEYRWTTIVTGKQIGRAHV